MITFLSMSARKLLSRKLWIIPNFIFLTINHLFIRRKFSSEGSCKYIGKLHCSLTSRQTVMGEDFWLIKRTFAKPAWQSTSTLNHTTPNMKRILIIRLRKAKARLNYRFTSLHFEMKDYLYRRPWMNTMITSNSFKVIIMINKCYVRKIGIWYINETVSTSPS